MLAPITSDNIHDSVTRLTTISTNLTEHVNISNNQTTTLSNITSEIAQLKVGCDSIQAISSSQTTQILDMLRQLQDQVACMSTSTQAAPQAVFPANDIGSSSCEANGEEPAGTEDEILEAIERLCTLVGEKEDVAESEDAAELVGQIDKLTTHLKSPNQIRSLEGGGDQTMWDQRQRFSEKEFKEDMKILNCIASGATKIVVNKPRKSRFSLYPM